MPRILFTAATAREMAIRSHEARKAAKFAVPLPTPRSLDAEDFMVRRLARVREQLEMVDAAIQAELAKREPDGQRVDRLAAASMRLSDQEFALAGRPKPGQRRPGPERAARTGVFWGGPAIAPPEPPKAS